MCWHVSHVSIPDAQMIFRTLVSLCLLESARVAYATCTSIAPKPAFIHDARCAEKEPNVTYIVQTNAHHREIFERMFRNTHPCVAKSFTVVCMDSRSFYLCRKDRAYRCVRARVNASASDFMKGDFQKINYEYKYAITRDVLSLNRSVFFFDDDVTLFQFPQTRHLSTSVTWQYQAEQCTKGLNSGVMLVRPTTATLKMSEEMCVTQSKELDQTVLERKLAHARIRHDVLPESYTGKCCRGCSKPKDANWVTFHAHCSGDVPSKRACLDSVLKE